MAEALEVPLPRPRLAQEVRRQREFIDLTNYIWESLRSSLTKQLPETAA